MKVAYKVGQVEKMMKDTLSRRNSMCKDKDPVVRE